MPSDSPLQAIVEYCRSKTVSGSPVKAYRDSAPAEEGGTAVVPPYVVVRDDGGPVVRDLEGNEFGPSSYSFTVYAGSAALARQIFDTVLYNAQPPKDRAGIESPGAILSYLTGFTQADVFMDQSPVERRAPARRVAELQHTVFVRLKVFTTRS